MVAGDRDGVPLGDVVAAEFKMSVIRRIDGLGGNMYVPLAMYSLRMSFCIVPESALIGTPCFSATAMYIESSIDAGALIVIDVETLSSGI